MADRVKRVLVLSEKNLSVPRDDTVSNFMPLDPPMLWLGHGLINQNPFGVGDPERRELGLRDGFTNKHRPLQDLLACHLHTGRIAVRRSIFAYDLHRDRQSRQWVVVRRRLVG